MKVALIQQICSADREENFQKSLHLIREAAQKSAELIVLQELHNSLYFCQSEDVNQFEFAEPIPGPSSEALAALATELQIVIVASLFEKRAPGLHHNTAIVLDKNGTIAGKYRKMHIPDDPGFYEKFYFTPGDLGFKPIQTSIGKLGVLVCWDQWFPESARLMAMQGAEILIYPTAIAWNPGDDKAEKERQRDAWLISQRAHAIANGLPVVSVNRVGHEEDSSGASFGLDFWGSSFVAGPQGEILGMASTDREEILLVEIDAKRIEEVRRIWPFFRDRRIEAYDGLNQRYLD